MASADGHRHLAADADFDRALPALLRHIADSVEERGNAPAHMRTPVSSLDAILVAVVRSLDPPRDQPDKRQPPPALHHTPSVLPSMDPGLGPGGLPHGGGTPFMLSGHSTPILPRPSPSPSHPAVALPGDELGMLQKLNPPSAGLFPRHFTPSRNPLGTPSVPHFTAGGTPGANFPVPFLATYEESGAASARRDPPMANPQGADRAREFTPVTPANGLGNSEVVQNGHPTAVTSTATAAPTNSAFPSAAAQASAFDFGPGAPSPFGAGYLRAPGPHPSMLPPLTSSSPFTPAVAQNGQTPGSTAPPYTSHHDAELGAARSAANLRHGPRPTRMLLAEPEKIDTQPAHRLCPPSPTNTQPDHEPLSRDTMPVPNENGSSKPKMGLLLSTVAAEALTPPSQHCHICTRKEKLERVAICQNIRKGLCRKVVCNKCFKEHGWDFDSARAADNGWICTHCARTCPERAQCRTYSRVNETRRKRKYDSQASGPGPPSLRRVDSTKTESVQPPPSSQRSSLPPAKASQS